MLYIILFALIGAKLSMGVAYWIIFGITVVTTIVKTIIDIARRG